MNTRKTEGKKVAVANFNIVFVDKGEEYPLLNYFESILMPALLSGITRNQGDSTYLFMNVEVKKDYQDEYVLTGLIVRSTILESKSILDNSGNLIEMDEIYPTAPFSTFVIYLKNHRMILVENQKGSPSLKSFRSTVNYIINTYVTRENYKREKENEQLLPIPLINIVGIPPKGGMASAIKKAEKIKTLTLRFYPLNGDGDLDLSGLMSGMSKEVRRRIGSDRGEVVYRSPRNINGVIEVVENAEGTVEPIIVAKYPGNKGETSIRNDGISDRRKLFILGETREEELLSIVNQGKEIDSINYSSDENNKIYSINKNKMELFLKNRIK